MKQQRSAIPDDFRRSQSGIPKGAEDMFGLPDEQDLERGRPSHIGGRPGQPMDMSKRDQYNMKKNDVSAIDLYLV